MLPIANKSHRRPTAGQKGHLWCQVRSDQSTVENPTSNLTLSSSDPYVRIDLNTIAGDENIDSVLTKTKKKTLNPRWNEEFVFRVKPNEHKLVFQVFDENRLTRDDFLGMVELSLAQLPKETEGAQIPPKSYPLRPRRSVGYVWVFVAIFICYFWLTTFICCFFGFFGWIFWTENYIPRTGQGAVPPPGILTPTRTPHILKQNPHLVR